ncbi:MAG: Mut7-C RNAse domain-containing protein [Spirochaetia bacterium]
MAQAFLRFYQELNEFLPPEKQKREFSVEFNPPVSVKHVIESQNIPHTEVDLILVNSDPVDFQYLLQPGDRVSVYPMFESVDISAYSPLRQSPLRNPKFIADVHLGKLARLLRLCGFDTEYNNYLDDKEIADLSVKEKRAILTRDRGLLKRKKVNRGYCVRSQNADKQLREVFERFDLFASAKPFSRCISCNSILERADNDDVVCPECGEAKKWYTEFWKCTGCGKIFWKGPHYWDMIRRLKGILPELNL